MSRTIIRLAVALAIAVLLVVAFVAISRLIPVLSAKAPVAAHPAITCRIGTVVDKSASEIPGQEPKLTLSIQYPDAAQPSHVMVPQDLFDDKEPGDTWKNCG